MSQEKQILHYLKGGHRITPLEALIKFQCMRLGARIFDLKQRGIRIETRIVERGEKRFAEYRLAKRAA